MKTLTLGSFFKLNIQQVTDGACRVSAYVHPEGGADPAQAAGDQHGQTWKSL